MQLIGMLDSPYVRRVAISLQLLKLPFQHKSISVFRGYAEFAQINPVVKAPTLICHDGTVLMDSTLILQYAEALAGRALRPNAPHELAQMLRVVGLALAAGEKSVQIVYERAIRPPEMRYQPWVTRVTGQMQAAFAALEHALARLPLAATPEGINDAGITTASIWHFAQQSMPELVPAAEYPNLVAHSAQAEALPEFKAAPHGESVYVGAA